MRVKKKILLIAITLLMVFSALFTVPDSYAYWGNVTLETTTSGTGTIGEWVPAFTWDPAVSYNIGDRATYNGSTWIATKAHSGKTPSTSAPGSNFWILE